MKEKQCQQAYGINLDVYEGMKEQQDNCCWICGTSGGTYKNGLCLDHNHESGEVRKFLCPRCNMLVGVVENDQGIMFLIYQYIADHE